MAIEGLHIPSDGRPMSGASVNQKDGMSYYPYVSGGPIESALLEIAGIEVMAYVNSRYASFDETTANWRASALFEMSGVGMVGGAIRGDALLVRAAGNGDYERSLPPELIQLLIGADESTSD